MNGKRKVVISVILAAMLLTLAGVGFNYWYNSTYFVSTEDAKVTGDFIKVTPQLSGKLAEFTAQEGDMVEEGQIIGRLDAAGATDSGIDATLLRAPISGLIVKRQAEVGEFAAAGSALAVMIDRNALYITANIEETKLERVKPGEIVDITIDQFEGKKLKGKVEAIGQAANSAFSLLPTSTGGTFTKVVQKVPVKIEIQKTGLNLLPGTNAVVKIHVK